MTDPGSLPLHTPEVFGAAADDGRLGLTVLRVTEDAPAPQQGLRPAVQRLVQGDGANLIAFTFTPGQALPDHRAAHPITVECVRGVLDLTCDGQVVRLVPGVVAHLRDRLVHRVDCPSDAASTNVLLLTMLTGERHG